MARHAALRVGERDDATPASPALDDLAVDELAPHLGAVGRAHAVVHRCRRPQVDLAGVDAEALRPPPLLQRARPRSRPARPVARRVEDAADLERLHRSTTTLKPPQKKRLPSNGIFFGSIIARDALVLHHLLVHAVAVLAVLVDDPGEPHHLAWLELHRLRETRCTCPSSRRRRCTPCSRARRTRATPCRPCVAMAAVGLQVLLRYRQYESVYVSHDGDLLGRRRAKCCRRKAVELVERAASSRACVRRAPSRRRTARA